MGHVEMKGIAPFKELTVQWKTNKYIDNYGLMRNFCGGDMCLGSRNQGDLTQSS